MLRNITARGATILLLHGPDFDHDRDCKSTRCFGLSKLARATAGGVYEDSNSKLW